MDRQKWIDYMYQTTGIDKESLAFEYDKNYKPNIITMYNSVKGDTFDIDANELYEKLKTCIIIESGAMFYNQHQRLAVPAKSIMTLSDLRGTYKNLMKKAKEEKNILGVKKYNGSQLDTKVCMNTYYGIQLNIYSKFYNQDVAASITARGRGTVSMNGLTLEACYGKYRPYRVDALLDFIENTRNKFINSDILDEIRLPTIDEVVKHVIGERKDYYGENIIRQKIKSLDEYELKKVFISSNYKEFIKIPIIKDILKQIILYNNSVYKQSKELPIREYKDLIYIDPSSPPKPIQDICKVYDQMVNDLLFGFYWYEGDFDEYGNVYESTEEIFKSITRHCVIITDTDSLILGLKPQSNDIKNLFPDIDKMRSNIDDEFFSYILGAIIINTTSLIVAKGLYRYTGQSRIPEDYRKYIQYKQEYFFKTLQTTDGAKNYLGIITMQEGVFLPIEEIDLKGLSLKKANFNRYLSDQAREIAVNMIAKADTPDVKKIFEKINEVRTTIPSLFKTKDNLDVFTVSKLGVSYEDMDIGEHRSKAVMTYNKLFDAKINLPGAFLITKIDLAGKEEQIQERFPDIYKKMEELVEERRLSFTKVSIQNRCKTLEKAGLLTDDINNIAEEIYQMNDFDEIKKYINEIRKVYRVSECEQSTKDFVEKIAAKNYTIADIDRIAIPLESETVPTFITEHIDIRDVAVFENLIAVLIKGLGFIVVRNTDDRQLITNMLSYY